MPINATLRQAVGFRGGASGGLSASSPASELPTGVTLQAIDGETMLSATTMSKDYFGRHGFTRATNTGFNKSWDDPTFFPVHTFFVSADTGGLTKAVDLGYNNATGVFSSPVWSSFDTFDFWFFNDFGNDAPDGTTASAFIVGTFEDEPVDENVFVTTSPGANITLGPIWINFTHASFVTLKFGSDGSGPNIASNFIYPNTFWTTLTSEARGLDITSYDLYWYAGSTSGLRKSDGRRLVFQSFSGGSLTEDQMARGNNYGCAIDLMRRDWMPSGALTTPAVIPLAAFVENNEAIDAGNGSRAITTNEMICAAWSTIIHGSRMLPWFYWGDVNTLSAGNARYDTTKTIDDTIQSLAPVLNAPFAIDYVSVDLNGYIFPNLNQTAWQNFTNLGIQCCAKWYNGSTIGNCIHNRFYIIASTTYGASGYTTKNPVFTLTGGAGTTATVLYSSDSGSPSPISITGGQFTDSFPHQWSVRVYRIDP